MNHLARIWIAALVLISGAGYGAAACTVSYIPHAYEVFDGGNTHALTGQVLVAGKPYRKEFLAGECPVPMTAYLRNLVHEIQPDILLLGEVHDNPIHHAYRSLWLDVSWKGVGSRPALVAEHIRADQQAALNDFRGLDPPGAAADLFRLLEWDKSGWPEQKIFEPLFAAAIAAKLPIIPGDPAKGKVREVARGGFDVIPAEDRGRMRLDTTLPELLAADLAAELKGSHCGLLPETAVPGMSRAQHYRDAHLADQLIKAAGLQDVALLVAGNGHVRADRGVPWHVRQRDPAKKVVSVMLIEVEDGKTDPDSYVPRDPAGKPAADFILFTPRAERKDPCAEMLKAYGRK